MKTLILDTYYPPFLTDFYRGNDIATRSYAEQRQALFAECFGTCDYYSRHLKSVGVEAEELIVNCAPLQLRWAREHDYRSHALWGRVPPSWTRWRRMSEVISHTGALWPILAEQIRRARPDVLYSQDPSAIPPALLRSVKSSVKLVVGQIASPLPPDEFLQPYDLILTSFPHFVPRLRAKGIAAEYFRIAFEPGVLERVGPQTKRYGCSFVGGVSPAHGRGTAFLEHMAQHADVDFFGYGADLLDAGSAIRRRHHGRAWGLTMYRTVAQSHVALNRHIDVAENYANNMRLYEATGMGAMLLTDAKTNLGELFEIGKEVVVYESAEDAVAKLAYYNDHPIERDAIARKGQERTLREHTYEQRMVELAAIFRRYLVTGGNSP